MGGLLRDEHSIWVFGFSDHLGITTNMHVELVAICQGLSIVVDMKVIHVEFETNSLEVVRFISSEDIVTHEFDIIIEDIKHSLTLKLMFKIRHVFREANRCVNVLANMGAQGSTKFCLWQEHRQS